MRTWVGGLCLTVVTACGVFFVLASTGNPSHCGPCLTGTCPTAAVTTVSPPSTAPDVIDLVDVRQPTVAGGDEPQRLPFLSFDEPPLANRGTEPMTDGGIVQAGFVAPATIPLVLEVAPAPRPIPAAGFPLRSDDDPF